MQSHTYEKIANTVYLRNILISEQCQKVDQEGKDTISQKKKFKLKNQLLQTLMNTASKPNIFNDTVVSYMIQYCIFFETSSTV